MRMGFGFTARAGTLVVATAAWLGCAWLLARTSVPALDLSGVDVHALLPARELERARRYSFGTEMLWVAGEAVKLVALAVLAWRLPRVARGIGLGRVGASVIVGVIVLSTLWAVSLPFSIAALWWQHHWGLGSFDVASWLGAQWGSLAALAITALATIVVSVGLAVRFPDRWWLPASLALVGITALFALGSGWLAAVGTAPVQSPSVRRDIERLETIEHVRGTPVRVQKVSSRTGEVNAYTAGIGPSANVVLWDTLLDGRLTRREIEFVIAHELGHVRSRHILKTIGWSALVSPLAALLIVLALRRRGGLRDPANIPAAALVLAVIALAATPLVNVVSRRYEAEADWRALDATRDPVAASNLFRSFARTSLDDPSPPLWDYVMLENHPTLAQRVALAARWRARNGP
jgi:STE24 endopeptidase